MRHPSSYSVPLSARIFSSGAGEKMRILPVHRCCTALTLGFFILTSITSGSVAAPAYSKLSSDLESHLNSGDASRMVDVIVQSSDFSLEGLRANLRGHGASFGRDLRMIDGLVASVRSEEHTSELQSRPHL